MANTKCILGFIAGAATGAIAGILLAPGSGTATRRKIAAKSGELTNALKDSFSGWGNSLQKGADNEISLAEQDMPANMHSGAL